jgi:hypothetical protein
MVPGHAQSSKRRAREGQQANRHLATAARDAHDTGVTTLLSIDHMWAGG